METFKNLYQFIEHCEDIIQQAKENNKDEFALITIMAQANHLNDERLLNDARITLEVYYDFLQEAIAEELFIFCSIIVKAKNIEIDHYIALAQTIIPEDAIDFKKQIIALDIILNDQYLSNE